MPGATYICGGDDVCPRPGHGKFIYFCRICHDEWVEKNPNTSKVLRSGTTDPSSLRQAKKKDAALRAEQSTPVDIHSVQN